MMSLQPYLPPASGDGIAQLLQVLSNPGEAKKALERIIEAHKAIDNATEKQAEDFKRQNEALTKQKIENEREKHASEMLASKAATELGTARSTLALAERRKAEIEAAEGRVAQSAAAVEEREERLDVSSRELQAKWAELRNQQAAYKGDAENLKHREDDLRRREQQLADDIAENQRWLAGLKPPRGR